jgi:dihydroxyacetone kinase
MTRLYNDPSHFADEAIDGFVAANRESVGRVAGGVLRAVGSPVGQVAVVIGGGSGHYPAFAGLVGPGMAAGAALGNVFASPSTNQIVSVAKAAQRGGGVLFTYGNYAGDVLNFSAAQDRLREDGVACESVPVTDDISSASVAERRKRRGIASDLAVFKIAGAAAAEGWSLADVAGAARRANDRTRTLGVAFTGCTLPGAEAPLFTVPEGRMAVGLGIHGEPGLDEADVPTANGLAGLLVQRLLQELPSEVASAEGQRVVVILNGLGSVKYDELFVVYREADRLLRGSGITVVDCEVGEICTSFDMAGVSLTLVWLDEELERLWLEPAETPAFRRGAVAIIGDRDAGASTARPVETLAPPASEASRQSAARAVEIFAANPRHHRPTCRQPRPYRCRRRRR